MNELKDVRAEYMSEKLLVLFAEWERAGCPRKEVNDDKK